MARWSAVETPPLELPESDVADDCVGSGASDEESDDAPSDDSDGLSDAESDDSEDESDGSDEPDESLLLDGAGDEPSVGELGAVDGATGVGVACGSDGFGRRNRYATSARTAMPATTVSVGRRREDRRAGTDAADAVDDIAEADAEPSGGPDGYAADEPRPAGAYPSNGTPPGEPAERPCGVTTVAKSVP